MWRRRQFLQAAGGPLSPQPAWRRRFAFRILRCPPFAITPIAPFSHLASKRRPLPRGPRNFYHGLLGLYCCVLLAGCAPFGGSVGWERSDGTGVVQRAVEAHGGLEQWRGFERASFHYRESWSFPFRAWNPWPSSPMELDLAFGLHDGRVTASPMPAGDWKPDFVLPRTRYLTLLPWKFLDKGARREYLGRRDGSDVVLVTFSASAGDTPGDRYWAHFDTESGRLERVILTVTAYGPLAVGDLRYEDYREVEGLLLPSRIRARLAGVGAPLHLGEYSEWALE